MTKRQYLIDEDLLSNWRDRLATALRYRSEQEQAQKTLNAVIGSMDSILASGDYQQE